MIRLESVRKDFVVGEMPVTLVIVDGSIKELRFGSYIVTSEYGGLRVMTAAAPRKVKKHRLFVVAGSQKLAVGDYDSEMEAKEALAELPGIESSATSIEQVEVEVDE